MLTQPPQAPSMPPLEALPAHCYSLATALLNAQVKYSTSFTFNIKFYHIISDKTLT